jgi:hypothetical protein
VKNNLIVDIEEHRVRSLSGTYAGRIHDKRICDEEDYTFPPGCVLFKDTGFQGFEPEQVATYQPQKKPRNQELRAEEKAGASAHVQYPHPRGTCHCRYQTMLYCTRHLAQYQSPL